MKYKHLTLEQRYEIKAYLKCNKSQKFIAQQMGVSESTISRELKRNKLKRGGYNPQNAQEQANIRKERFAVNRKFTPKVAAFVEEKIRREQWSPQQIVGYCKKHEISMVSTEKIYQYIREDKEKGGDLYQYLRHQLKHRKRPVSGKKEVIKNRKPIRLRPEIVLTNEEFGHFEVDLIVGAEHKGAILTIVERKTKFLIMRKLSGKNAKSLAKAMIYALLPYKDYVKTITSDNGLEFSEHEYISKKLSCDFYFANPYCSWERGLSENTNKLVRQYIPKGTYFEKISKEKIKEIQHKINRRPRLTLDFEDTIPLSV
ncbi:IS30 family transposase [Capnocytophaga sp. H4358]|uniref:IS30 family transposase n=1 Tax=Capnocytophaga sp. H4358 TaxID=1945658 RepID=UPI000BB1BAAE|nr:IS30 family transposase [Capnocytophaga sp. H4358]ATA72040.1 IS30 family transposase [Capnocytophaga sp. H4358]